ncbi:MAG: TRAP transporter substrate-binding protein [Spirochaetes bacterium]|nr:TRAP transporter substrate-binding protein [Spirochaetota bacterium]
MKKLFVASMLAMAMLWSVSGQNKIVEFKFAGNNSDVLATQACIKIATNIAEKSQGTLKPSLFLEGQLGNNDEELNTGLTEGNFEMLLNAEMLFNWAVPDWMSLFNMAFIFDDQAHLQRFWNSDVGDELASAVLKKYNILTANKPIKQVGDLAGLKLRTPNNAGVIASWKAAGANVTPVAWGELFGALQNGVVNAQENPLANIDQAAIYQVQKYLMQTEHQYTNFFIYFNNKWWKTLSADQQKIIAAAIDKGFSWYNEQVNLQDEAFIKKFKEKGMTLITKDQIDIASFKNAIIPVLLKQNASSYPPGAYDKIQSLRKK